MFTRHEISEYESLLSDVLGPDDSSDNKAAMVHPSEDGDDDVIMKDEENDTYATREQLKQAYIKFMNTFASSSTSVHPISCAYTGCTSKCDFFDANPVFICRISGKVHFCNSTACAYIDRNESEMTCGLTGRVWGVRFQFGGERTKDEDSEMLTYTREGAVQTHTEIAVTPLFVRCEQSNAVSLLSSIVVRPKQQQQQQRHHHPNFNSVHEQRATIHNCVQSILAYLPKQFNERKEELVALCVSVWEKYIRNSSVYIAHPGKYLLLYHCLVVFNHTRDGCYLRPPNGCPIIPPDRMMRKCFPDMKDLVICQNGQPRGVTLRQFTKTKKIFKQALFEASSRKEV